MRDFLKIGLFLTLGVFLSSALMAQTETINETFDSGMPDDWTVVDNGSSNGVTLWHVTDAYTTDDDSYSLNGTKFAFINSDAAGDGTVLDAYLVSPVIDNSSANNVILQFTQNFRYNSDDFSAVEVWNGSEWVEVLKQEENMPNTSSISASWASPVDIALDLTEYKNADFQVRFHYYATWDWYWAIDNVKVSEDIVSYPLYIAGVQVDVTNATDLSVIDGVSGTVSYSNDTKTLTLENASIDGSISAIEAFINDFKITLIGSNNINAEEVTLDVYENTEINGNGSLTVLTNNAAIYVNEGKQLTIKDCMVEAISNYYGIVGDAAPILTIDNATVKATGTNYGSIKDIQLTLLSCAITAPAGAAYDEGLNGVALNGSIVTDQVVIMKTYELYLAGVQVDGANTSNLSTINGVDGTVTYDNVTKTLTLENATISGGLVDIGEDEPLNMSIYSRIADLTINLIGNNTLNADNVGLVVSNNTKINGTGSLTVTATNPESIGIFMGGSTAIIENCTINASGIINGIIGMENSLIVKNATVKAKGGTTENGGSIVNFAEIIFDNCGITAPTGSAFDTDLNGVALNGSLVTEQVVIELMETYDLEIAGVQVNESNASDLSVIEGVDGTVIYDHSTKTLTLSNATINGGDISFSGTPYNIAIISGIADLTINLIGDNSLEAEHAGFAVSNNTTINGSGSLSTTATSTSIDAPSLGIGIAASENFTLAIEDCTINASGYTAGIGGGEKMNLIVQNATVKAISNIGSIRQLVSLTLIDCAIITPEGAIFDEEEGDVVDAEGNTVTEQVVIEPDNGIEETEILGVSLYPNPAVDFVEISIDDANIKGLELQVYDMLGKLIIQQAITEQTTQLNIKNLEKGVYLLKVGNNTQRFVKN